MLIRISLALIAISLIAFLSVDILLKLAVPGLPEIMTRLGLSIMLGAFALLLFAGLLAIARLTMQTVSAYFSARQRELRKLLFFQIRQEQLKQRLYFRKLQIHYFNELKRKRLLNINNRKQINSLSEAISNDLLSIRKQLPKTTYLQLQQENIRYRNQYDSEALLMLQKKITRLF